MFCEKCGAPLAQDAKFCEKCGARVEDIKENKENRGNTKLISAEKKENPLKKIPAKAWVGVGAAAVIILITAVFFATKKTTVNLNDYVKAEFYGYDTAGTAEVYIDEDEFWNDYGKKIKSASKSHDDYKEAASVLWELCVSGELDRDDNLSNGEVITYKWECNDELAMERFNCKLKYEDLTFTVEGLEEVTAFDPFEGVELIYEGVSPEGKAKLLNHSEQKVCSDLSYRLEQDSELGNGDEITVTVTGPWGKDIKAYCLEQYGMVPTEVEKTYTVEGLGKYATSLEEIPDDVIEKMRKQAEDELLAYTAENWVDEEKVEEIEYLGNYLLISKKSDEFYSSNADNILYLIFKVHGSDNFEEGSQETYSYYYYTAFDDIVILPDGTCPVELSDYSTPGWGESFSRKVQYGTGPYDFRSLTYNGYESLDMLFNKKVTARADEYTYESDVEDSVEDIEPEESAEEIESTEAAEQNE